MGLIQTPDQLKFSYLAIVEGAKGLGLVRLKFLVFKFLYYSFCKTIYIFCRFRSPEKFFPNLSDLKRDLCYLQIRPRLPMMTSMTTMSIQVIIFWIMHPTNATNQQYIPSLVSYPKKYGKLLQRILLLNRSHRNLQVLLMFQK